MRNKSLVAYTRICGRLRDIPLSDRKDPERCAIIVDNLVEEYNTNDEELTEDEMQYLLEAVCFYAEVTTKDA